MSSGSKKQPSPLQNRTKVKQWQKRLADLEWRHQSFIDAGMEDTIWSVEIRQLKELIAGASSEDLNDGE